MGWISLDRKIMDNFLWFDEPFTKAQAWIDLLLLANHEDAEILFNGSYRKIKRGQHLTSTVKLATRWKWSRNKVSRFLSILRSAEMIQSEAGNGAGHGTIITIVNYDKYQNQRSINGAINGAYNGAIREADGGADGGAQTIRRTRKQYNNRPNTLEEDLEWARRMDEMEALAKNGKLDQN